MKKFVVVKEVITEDYQSSFSTEIIEANSLLEVLSDFADDCGMEWEEEDEINTDEKAIEAINSFNGDECDLLISVTDLDAKKVVYKW